MDRSKDRVTSTAVAVCLTGAVLQLGYGVAAIAFPYPTITDRGFELLWVAVTLGMIAGVIAWLQLDLAGPPTVVHVAGAVAILGFLLRIAVSIWLVADPSAAPDQVIVASILLMFAGVGTIGVCTVRTHRLTGWRAWVPLSTVAAGIITATWYSIHRTTHFALLGLLWGSTWLLLAHTAQETHRHSPTPAATHPAKSASRR
jgi:hypothetical protein